MQFQQSKLFLLIKIHLHFLLFLSLPQNRLQSACTLLLTSITFRWTVNRSLVSWIVLFFFYYLSFSFQPTVSYLTSLDKYAILCIFAIVGQCIWHAIIGAIIFLSASQDQLTPSMWYTYFDRYVFITMISVFIIMHIVLIIWLYQVPFGHRKNMSKTDVEYQFLISNMIIEENSKAIGKNADRSSLFMRIPIWTKA